MDLVALVKDFGQVQVEFANVLKADVLGVEEGAKTRVFAGAHIDGDFAVELTSGDVAQLPGREAQALEVGGAFDVLDD